jgi:hypothetical protein
MRPARQASSGRTPPASAATRRPAVECDLNTDADSRRCLMREGRADNRGDDRVDNRGDDRVDNRGDDRVDVGYVAGEGGDSPARPFDGHPSADANAMSARGSTGAGGDKACLYGAVEHGLCANAEGRRDSRVTPATACVTACPIMSGRAGSRGVLPPHAGGLGGDGAPLARWVLRTSGPHATRHRRAPSVHVT